MATKKLSSYIFGSWTGTTSGDIESVSSVTGEVIACGSGASYDFGSILTYARETGGRSLRGLSFVERASTLKSLATYLNDRRDALYELSRHTGALPSDDLIDIDGGISTLFVYSSKGRRELPAGNFLVEGAPEPLSRDDSFFGHHLLTPLRGAALHINAFNFPVWGMLQKLAPCFLAGVPAIVKPATPSCYLAQRCFELMIESNLLPEGSVQLLVGSVGDMLDHLTGQDIVSFTGSSSTSSLLHSHPVFTEHSVRFISERDSLNSAILGADANDVLVASFIDEVIKEMTSKAGQKCTAIRRIMVPRSRLDSVTSALTSKTSQKISGTTMGSLIGLEQRDSVLSDVALFESLDGVECVYRGEISPDVDSVRGAFVPIILFRCDSPHSVSEIHDTEIFGPVATILPYDDVADLGKLLRLGGGSLVASVFTDDSDFAYSLTLEAGSYHGRLLFVDSHNIATHTGHGSPLPHLVHGGPGRAGGGEELGGLRALNHYLQRTSIQASPNMLSALSGVWTRGSSEREDSIHPFRVPFDELEISTTLHTSSREVTLEDIEHFAHFTGDLFYAHMDEAAARANPFFDGRVAHGYLLLSFAAGLFVEPSPGPVLANYGLDSLRFLKPVSAGDSIRVRLTVKEKALRNPDYGEVRWDVEIMNQLDETVARYDLLTMNAVSSLSN